jgi:hypothetical protein
LLLKIFYVSFSYYLPPIFRVSAVCHRKVYLRRDVSHHREIPYLAKSFHHHGNEVRFSLAVWEPEQVSLQDDYHLVSEPVLKLPVY